MLTENEKKRLDEQGYLIFENVISADEADTMRNLALELAQEDIKAGRDYSHLKNARRVWNLVNKHEVFEQAIQHPRVIEAQQYLLGGDLVLSSFTANIIGSGAPAGNLHIDFPLGTLPAPRPSFALSANSVWFLDDFFAQQMVLHAVCPAVIKDWTAGRNQIKSIQTKSRWRGQKARS